MERVPEHIEQLTQLSKAKSFLGREFLTWLWYEAETSKERLRLTLEEGKSVEIDLWVDDRLVLEGTATMSHQNVMKGGDPSHSREAAASLATGKTVREMKLGVNVKDFGEYSAILHCDDLNPRSLKLPAPGGADGEGEASAELPLAQRLRATAQFASVLDALFAHFLNLRMGDSWEKTVLVDMRAWIKRRQKQDESAILH